MAVKTILPSTNLKYTDIRDTLNSGGGSVNNEVSSAFASTAKINPWSKWKPVVKYGSKAEHSKPITLAELEAANYGVKLLKSNNLNTLITDIKNNGNLGYTYNRPTSYFRLGDYRNYSKNAVLPVDNNADTYIDGEIRIKGASESNRTKYERIISVGIIINSSDTLLGVNELYPLNEYNLDTDLKIALLVTDGKSSQWFTDKLYWWDSQLLKFAGKTVDVYEFYTNVTKGAKDMYTPSHDDLFIALPHPHFTLNVLNDYPDGAFKVFIKNFKVFFTDSTYSEVNYEVSFSAVGSEYSGGTIENVYFDLAEDREGKKLINSVKVTDSLNVPDETVSQIFKGTIRNRSLQIGESPKSNVWFIVYFDYKLQKVAMPMLFNPSPIQ